MFRLQSVPACCGLVLPPWAAVCIPFNYCAEVIRPTERFLTRLATQSLRGCCRSYFSVRCCPGPVSRPSARHWQVVPGAPFRDWQRRVLVHYLEAPAVFGRRRHDGSPISRRPGRIRIGPRETGTGRPLRRRRGIEVPDQPVDERAGDPDAGDSHVVHVKAERRLVRSCARTPTRASVGKALELHLRRAITQPHREHSLRPAVRASRASTSAWVMSSASMRIRPASRISRAPVFTRR